MLNISKNKVRYIRINIPIRKKKITHYNYNKIHVLLLFKSVTWKTESRI